MRILTVPISSSLLAVALLVSAATSVGAHPQPPAPTLDIANPGDGEMLTPGRMIIQGVAYDDSAETGVGIDRVSVFIGDRDEDNQAEFLGDARLGLLNSQKVFKEECEPETRSFVLCPEGREKGDSQFDLAGWSLLTPVLKGTGKEVLLFIYARSSVSGAEVVETVKVTLGEGDDEGGPDDGGPDEP
jgi:hypothetical protein